MHSQSPESVTCNDALVYMDSATPSLQVQEVASRHGVLHMSPDLHAFFSTALEAHLGGLLRRAAVLSRQRADVGRRVPGMEVSMPDQASLAGST